MTYFRVGIIGEQYYEYIILQRWKKMSAFTKF